MTAVAVLIPRLAQTAAPGGSGSLIQTVVMFGAIILVFYFMILRPQQKRTAQHRKMLEALKKGDKVVLTGGMHGNVAGFDDGTVLVEVAPNVKIKFDKGSITSITTAGN